MSTNINGSTGYPINYLPYQTRNRTQSPFLADQSTSQNTIFNSTGTNAVNFTSQSAIEPEKEKKGGFLKKAVLAAGAIIGTVALVKTGKSGKVGKLWKELGTEAVEQGAKQAKRAAVKEAAKDLGGEFVENLKFWKWFKKPATEAAEKVVENSTKITTNAVGDIPKGCELVHTGENGLKVYKTVDGAYVTQYSGQTGINFYGTNAILGADDFAKAADNNLPAIVGDKLPVTNKLPDIPGSNKVSTVVADVPSNKTVNLFNKPKSLDEVPAIPKTADEARAILGVSEDASSQEIKKAYRTLAKMYHTDIGAGNEITEAAIRAINVANDKLT